VVTGALIGQRETSELNCCHTFSALRALKGLYVTQASPQVRFQDAPATHPAAHVGSESYGLLWIPKEGPSRLSRPGFLRQSREAKCARALAPFPPTRVAGVHALHEQCDALVVRYRSILVSADNDFGSFTT
jgi:hypothetical protein